MEFNTWYTLEELIKYNKIFDKIVRMIDHKISARENMAIKNEGMKVNKVNKDMYLRLV